MKKFYETKRGKIASKAIHDHANSSIGARYNLNKALSWLNYGSDNPLENKLDKIKYHIKEAKERIKRMDSEIDYFYNNIKELEDLNDNS